MSTNLHQLVRPLQPWADKLLKLAQSRGTPVSVTSVRRTRGLQRRLYQDFLQGRSRYPAAPPGRSKHELGLAFDIVGSPEVLAYLGKVWESWGGTWGGRFHDPIHFEA